jgi:hypothetical protein
VWIYDLAADTATEVAAMHGLATMGAYLDGYFLAFDATESKLYVSALMDGLTWSPGTDFARRSMAPDAWLAMLVAGRFAWLLGRETSEAWYNSGERFPFTPHPSGLIDFGIAATWSAKVIESDPIWLAHTASGRVCVVKMRGFTPEVVSTPALELAIQSYGDVSGAVADVYSDMGHTFYILNFELNTWVWDASTKLWAERGTWIPEQKRFTAWRPRFLAHAFGEHRALDAATGDIYRMSSALTLDVGGLPLRRLRRAPAISSENKRVFYSSFELDLEPGLGDTEAGSDNPQVMLRLSNDGGKTWVTEQMRGAGKIGEYGRRVRWNRLGSARRRVFEVSVTDPIPWRLTGAYIESSGQVGRG